MNKIDFFFAGIAISGALLIYLLLKSPEYALAFVGLVYYVKSKNDNNELKEEIRELKKEDLRKQTTIDVLKNKL